MAFKSCFDDQHEIVSFAADRIKFDIDWEGKLKRYLSSFGTLWEVQDHFVKSFISTRICSYTRMHILCTELIH